MNDKVESPTHKSNFVNVLAWIFIVIGGSSTFISILQNIMIQTIFPKQEIAQAMEQAEQFENIPAVAQIMFNNFDLFFLFFLVISVVSLISAIALLKRKNWARLIFIILMSFGIAWNILGLVLQFTIFGSMPEFGAGNIPPEFNTMMLVMRIASVIMVIGTSALFGFIIKKLCSKKIKAEFA